ncbi:MAG: M20 family metallopeptidase, partial [Clostridia bacterium]|nr:M20 family metallopeptidase [Clostridia bacterium]
MLEQAMIIREEMVQHRRAIHRNAEIRFDLPLTRAYVLETLTGMGYSPREVGGGIVAVAGDGSTRKTFLLRADMDALPIREENDLPFRSQTGFMHACGHDLHTAMLLGAARLLKACEHTLKGRVKLMFQPAEEVMGGAIRMIDEGLLADPPVDAAMMIHVLPALPAPAGTAIFSGGHPNYSACDWFEISIQGKGGHGAMPDKTVDPLNVAAHTHIALQAVVAREVGPQTPIVVTVGEMHGGTVSNVIPDTATLRGTIRTFDESARAFAKERVRQIAQGVAETFRA